MSVGERVEAMRAAEKEAENNVERIAQNKINAEMSEIRKRFTQFKHCKVSEEAMRVFARYMKDKMTNKQYKKTAKRDLGLAAIDTHVIFSQMERNDSENFHLLHTNDNRCSMKDMNGIRPSNYLNSYLERVTNKVKVSKASVKSIQGESEWLNSSQNFDGASSMQKGSVIFRSKKGSMDVTKSGTQ